MFYCTLSGVVQSPKSRIPKETGCFSSRVRVMMLFPNRRFSQMLERRKVLNVWSRVVLKTAQIQIIFLWLSLFLYPSSQSHICCGMSGRNGWESRTHTCTGTGYEGCCSAGERKGGGSDFILTQIQSRCIGVCLLDWERERARVGVFGVAACTD